MTPEFVIKLAESGVYTVLITAGPLLLLALAVGLLISIFQATTQIQEQTLSFVPKIAAVLIGLVFFGPFMITKVLDFTKNIFSNLHTFVG